jgi:hypothetical protein
MLINEKAPNSPKRARGNVLSCVTERSYAFADHSVSLLRLRHRRARLLYLPVSGDSMTQRITYATMNRTMIPRIRKTVFLFARVTSLPP